MSEGAHDFVKRIDAALADLQLRMNDLEAYTVGIKAVAINGELCDLATLLKAMRGETVDMNNLPPVAPESWLRRMCS